MDMQEELGHNFDFTIDIERKVQPIERSSFYAVQGPEGPKGEPGYDCAGTFGSAGTFGGTFGSIGSWGCCC